MPSSVSSTVPLVLAVAGLLAMFVAAFVTHDTARAVFGLGMLFLGSTLEVIAYLHKILEQVRKPKSIEDLDREARKIRSRRKGE